MVALAMAFFSLVVVIYLAGRCFQAKRVNVPLADDQSVDEFNDQDALFDDPLQNVNEENLSFRLSPLTPKGLRELRLEQKLLLEVGATAKKPENLAPFIQIKSKKTIAERLEKNRQFAKAQQEDEQPKGFVIRQGSITEYLSINEAWQVRFKPLRGTSVIVNGKQVGIASCEGYKSTMEDADLAISISFIIKGNPYKVGLFGIFDGHVFSGYEGGDQFSVFLKHNLPKYLIEELERCNQEALTDEGIFKTLKCSFIRLNQDFTGSDYVGSTATVLLLSDEKIYVANTGDSRTILVKQNGKAVQASEDARPEIPRYHKKIKEIGGSIIYSSGDKPRVQGFLAVARAFGDKFLKSENGQQYIVPNPKITDYSLREYENGYAILASDGLYDIATTNEVGMALGQMANRRVAPEEMAKLLVWNAIKQGSKDNVSAIVVKL